MTDRIQAGGLQVAKELFDFVNEQAIPGTGVDQAAFEVAGSVFCLSRITHYLSYGFGIPVLRTLAFAVGWLATAFIGLGTFVQL